MSISPTKLTIFAFLSSIEADLRNYISEKLGHINFKNLIDSLVLENAISLWKNTMIRYIKVFIVDEKGVVYPAS